MDYKRVSNTSKLKKRQKQSRSKGHKFVLDNKVGPSLLQVLSMGFIISKLCLVKKSELVPGRNLTSDIILVKGI